MNAGFLTADHTNSNLRVINELETQGAEPENRWRLIRQPAHRGDLAQLPSQLDPRLPTGVAAIEITVSTRSENNIRIGGIRAKRPDCRVRFHRQRQQFPAFAEVVGTRHSTRRSRRKVAESKKNAFRIGGIDGDAAQISFLPRIFPRETCLHPMGFPSRPVIRARMNLAVDHNEDRPRRSQGHGHVVDILVAGLLDQLPGLPAVAAMARAVHLKARPNIVWLHWVNGNAGKPRRADSLAFSRDLHWPLVPSPPAFLRAK